MTTFSGQQYALATAVPCETDETSIVTDATLVHRAPPVSASTRYFEMRMPRQIHETTQEWSMGLGQRVRSSYRERQSLERLAFAREALGKCVETDAERYGGAPVIAGTRFPASQLLAELAEGASIVELAEDMSLPREKLSQLLSVLSAYLDHPRR